MMILDEFRTAADMDNERLQSLRTALNRYCLTLTRSKDEAEDLAQDTWTKILGYRGFTAAPNPEALLLRIAKNTWIDQLRRRTSQLHMLERLHRLGEDAPAENHPSELEPVFQALLRYLSPQQRIAWVMRDVLGYPAAEAAAELNTTEGAVKAALYRARQNLAEVRRELSAEGPASSGDEDFRQLLAALADAYTQGQIPVMLELLRHDLTAEVTMAVSTAPVQGRLITSRMSSGSNAMYSGLWMAA